MHDFFIVSEGDFMYTDQLNLLEEGIPTLDSEFINHSDNQSGTLYFQLKMTVINTVSSK